MRALLQRVTEARVVIHHAIKHAVAGEIGPGLLVVLGVSKLDTPEDAEFLAQKVLNLRIFHDEDGKMNHSVLDTGGDLLVVSQFTLYGECRKGRRPSFDEAAPAEQARSLYEHFVAIARRGNLRVETGVFQADMAVSLVNDGPVTLLLESR
jgi:D-tyrosyl-tRNA(Tyr) deacylase